MNEGAYYCGAHLVGLPELGDLVQSRDEAMDRLRAKVAALEVPQETKDLIYLYLEVEPGPLTKPFQHAFGDVIVWALPESDVAALG